MITEDYVSFEVAKLLKEKGFDVPCIGLYSVRSKEFHLDCTKRCNNGGLFEYAAPSHAMVMKWLRETHHIDICVCRELDEQGKCFNGYIAVVYQNDCYKVTIREVTEDLTYEEAANKAIKYCLTLI
jgi:hypothetical protein